MIEKKYDLSRLSMSVFRGFNTKQLWILEETNNVLIDPPAEVIDEIEQLNSEEEKEDTLLKIAETKPDWLFETDYWYDGDTEV